MENRLPPHLHTLFYLAQSTASNDLVHLFCFLATICLHVRTSDLKEQTSAPRSTPRPRGSSEAAARRQESPRGSAHLPSANQPAPAGSAERQGSGPFGIGKRDPGRKRHPREPGLEAARELQPRCPPVTGNDHGGSRRLDTDSNVPHKPASERVREVAQQPGGRRTRPGDPGLAPQGLRAARGSAWAGPTRGRRGGRERRGRRGGLRVPRRRRASARGGAREEAREEARRGAGAAGAGGARAGGAEPAGAGGAAAGAVASLPGAPGRRARLQRAAQPAGRFRTRSHTSQPGERAARPESPARAARAAPSRHGGVGAAAARGDHGGAGLGQGHRVVAHHQTLRAEAPLQRGPAPGQHAPGHRWEPGPERWRGAVARAGVCGRGCGSGESGAPGCGPGMRGPGCGFPEAGPGMRRRDPPPAAQGRDLRQPSHCAPKAPGSGAALGGSLGEKTGELGRVRSSEFRVNCCASFERRVPGQSLCSLRICSLCSTCPFTWRAEV